VGRLREALDHNGVDYQLEVIPGTEHGFAVPGRESYHSAGAEYAWARALALFAERMGGAAA
jgi:carboxymethylenebutenolidase